MTFFYDLNKKLADLAKKQDLNESAQPVAERSTGDYSAKKAAAGKDIGKPGKMFSKIAKSAGKRYGSKESGEKVAGAVLAKLRAKESAGDMDESALQAYLGKKKYGETGMKALQKAGRDGASKETMARIRAKHDKMDEEMADEGNAFTAKLKSTPRGGEFELDGKKYKDTSNIEEKKETKKSRSAGTVFDPEVAKSMFATKDEHPRYDVKDTGYSKRYTRKEQPEAEKDDAEVSDQPKKKGRPKSAKSKDQEHVTKGSYKYKMVGGKRVKKEKTDEDLDTDGVMMNTPSNMSSEDIESVSLINKGEYDREGEMAKDDLESLAMAAKELHSILGDDENLPEWVQSKITKALDYINSSNQYMHQQKNDAEPVAEKAVSQAQRRAAGIAHAAQKGEIPKSELRGASKEMAKMPKGELHKFAATKEKGLPKKVKEAGKPDFLDLDKDGNKAEPMKQAAKQAKGKTKDEVEETTVAGSVATSPASGKSKGGMQFGKGVYESMNKQYTQALTEGMNVTLNMGAGDQGEPRKSITITADGDDADKLAELLKMAGMGSHGDADSCGTCGKAPCGCEELDENSPDWPTNTETSDNALQYSGGLNGPKSTGQTTIPVIASQLRRQVSMEESVKLENDLFRLYKNYKAQ
jgi:hypothetical protein